jgi:hypothetical protein
MASYSVLSWHVHHDILLGYRIVVRWNRMAYRVDGSHRVLIRLVEPVRLAYNDLGSGGSIITKSVPPIARSQTDSLSPVTYNISLHELALITYSEAIAQHIEMRHSFR